MSKARRGRARRSRSVSLAPMRALGGDHGPNTEASMAGTEVRPVDGDNPNNIGRRQRVNVVDRLAGRNLLTMRQIQAARAIGDAYAKLQTLSSGGELKETVDSTPKPDATIAMQVDASSQWVHVMTAVPDRNRVIVEKVCCENVPVTRIVKGGAATRMYHRLRQSLDLVADHMRY